MDPLGLSLLTNHDEAWGFPVTDARWLFEAVPRGLSVGHPVAMRSGFDERVDAPGAPS